LHILQAEDESREAEQMKKKLAKNESTNLSALILRNQQSREQQMDAFYDDLAIKYGGQGTSKTTRTTQSVTKKSAKKTSKTTKKTDSKSQTKSTTKK